MTARRLLLGLAAFALAAGLALAGLLLAGRGGGEGEAGGGAACAEAADADAARTCYAGELAALVEESASPQEGVERADARAREEGGLLLVGCHGLMHTVGREYARERGVTLATLKDHLPRSSDPGCAAGFAHGLVTGVAPEIDPQAAGAAVGACDGSETRYQRYSCVHGFGHAFMRVSEGDLERGLALCRALGPEAPDCAQGAFHDYWFAVAGLDEAAAPDEVEDDPRRLCAAQAEAFVVPCWYRAFVDVRPPGQITVAADLQRLCVALEGLQREGCITAASVVGPADPRSQLALCAGLRGADALACIHGVKAQNFLGQSVEVEVALVERCENFAEPAARRECYRWLGKTLTVVTDGAFAETGCPALAREDARRACARGARDLDGPLVTFS